MPVLSPDEIRFELRRSLQELPRSVWRDLCGKPEAYERGLRTAVTLMLPRFERLTVARPEPDASMDFAGMDR
jgi:hypothetical protein